MEEVKIKDLEPGKDYYIQLVGRYLNKDFHNSGKAIGINFKKTLTFSEIRIMPNFSKINFIHGPGYYNDDDLFAQFEKVNPVNPGTSECGICHYEYYPSILPSWDTLEDEEKLDDNGGGQFFKMKKPEILLDSAMRQKLVEAGMRQELAIDPRDQMRHARTFIGGKTRRRRRKRKTKRRRKRKTKRRRKKTNTKYSKV